MSKRKYKFGSKVKRYNLVVRYNSPSSMEECATGDFVRIHDYVEAVADREYFLRLKRKQESIISALWKSLKENNVDIPFPR